MKPETPAKSLLLQAEKLMQIKKLFYVLLIACFLFHASASAQNAAIKQGNEAYKKSDFATAIKEYNKALSEDGKNSIAKFNMANALQLSNDADQSKSLYDEVIKNSTDASLQSKAYYNKALALLQQNKTNDAIDALKQSLRLQPADNDARENLAKALKEKQQQQPQPQQNKKQQQQNGKQQKQQQMNRQMMEQKFKELEDQEKQLQKEVQKQKTNPPDNEKDW